jgi:hypothetical protein
VNKWYFTSFVPNVASMEIVPLWPYANMDWQCIHVWMPRVNGTWILRLLEDKIRVLNDVKSKMELKWLGFCVTTNSLSYVSNFNTQCFIVGWSHPWS